MTVTNSEIGAYTDSLSDIGTPASGDELLIYDVSATTTKKVQASALAGIGGSVATDAIFDAKGDLPVGTGADTAQKLAVGSVLGQVLQVDATQTTGLKYGAAVRAGFVRRNGADYTLNNNSTFAAIDGTNLKLTVAAVSGDLIEVSLLARFGNEAVNAFIDACTLVSGSPVNYVSGGTGLSTNFGVAGWLGLSGVQQAFGGSAYYTLVSGDISSSTVTVQLMYRTGSAANKSLRAGTSSADALFFAVKNLGQ